MVTRQLPKIIIITTLIVAVFIITGCGSSNPLEPDSGATPGYQNFNNSKAPSPANRYLWGYWQGIVDIKNGSMDFIPMRDPSAHLNVVSLLEPVPLLYLKIDDSTLEIDVPNGTIDVDVILRHPIPAAPEYTGFDVRGIFITDGTMSDLSIDDSLIMAASDESRLMNADGYTRWWNPTEFSGTGLLGYKDGKIGRPYSRIGYRSIINGFKSFADGLSADGEVLDSIVIANRARFSSGSENRRHYSLKFGPEASDFMVFNYAVDASWERPLHMPPQSFDDFPMSANSFEPFYMKMSEQVNSLFWNEELQDCPKSGGILRVNLDIGTWQGMEGIKDVYIGAPEIGADFVAASESGGYDMFDAHISTYQGELVASSIETYSPQVIAVAYTDLADYRTGPEGLGIPFDGPHDARLAMYGVMTASVSSNSPPIVGPVLGPIDVLAGETHTYHVEEWYDCQDLKEDLVFSWEIGDDNPAIYNDGIGNQSGLFPGGNGTIDITFPDSGTYYVDARLKDLDDTYGYSSDPLEVHVGIPPIPEFPPEGVNLVLELERTSLYSYEYVNDPRYIPAVKLTWDGSAVSNVIAEWVIYRDDDPYDGTEDWLEIGTSMPQDTEYSNQLTGDFGYHSGGAYFYKVAARSVPGNPESESSGSTEWAFIEFENAEPDGASQDQWPWTMGYGGYESGYYRQWERPGYGGAVAGGCWMMDPDSAYMRRHQWSVIASPEIPILTDPVLAQTTEEWIIELVFGGQVTPMNECWDNYARLSVGTVPDDPSTHNTNQKYIEYDEAEPSDHLAGSEYYTQGYWSSNKSRFDETPTTYRDRYGWGRNEYGWPFNFARFRLVDLDPNGAARTRAAIGFGSGSTTDPRCRPRADEIAVIVY